MYTEADFLVSINCITYNQSSYITDAMDGFVMQRTNFPFVAVIIDDASTDGEQEVIRNYVDDHFDHSPESVFKEWETEDAFWTFAQHKENKNCHFVVVYLKRNLFKDPGKKTEVVKDWCNAKYIALCEGDDYWINPLKLQKQVDYLEGHRECCMVACAAYYKVDGEITGNDCISEEQRYLTTEEVVLGGGGYLATCSLVFDNSKLNDVVPNWRKTANVGDYPLQIQGTLVGKLRYFPEIMCVYRFNTPGSWSNKIYYDNELFFNYLRGEIPWMMELDRETHKRFHKVINERLLPNYSRLYRNRKASLVEYFRAVLAVGGWNNYLKLIKGCVKRVLKRW